MKNKKVNYYSLIPLVLIMVSTFLVYFQILSHNFLILDDSVYVTGNTHVRSGITLENIYWAFTSLHAEFWHPVTWLSYMLDSNIYGVIPGAYLFTNLIIHILNSVLVFYLFSLMTNKTWESLFISALFALHPLHVEPVAWISGRKELLCAFFWLASTISYFYYTQSPNSKKYLLVLVFFVLGIMSKSMIVTLPFVFLLLDFWPLKRALLQGPKAFTKWIRLVIEKILLFLVSAVGIIVTLIAQDKGGGIVSLENFSVFQRITNSFVSYFSYIKNTFWPENLSVFYPVKDHDPFVIVLSAVFFIVITIACLLFSKKLPFLTVGWFWFSGTLVPVIGIVKIGDFAMADRFMYMPFIGLAIILAFGTGRLISKSSYKTGWKIIIPFLILGCYVPSTYIQIKTWKNSEVLFHHSLNSVEKNFLAHHGLGELYAGKGKMNEALFHFSKAVEYRPDKAILWLKQGRAQYALQLKENAIESFKKALACDPLHYAPHFYLFCAYLDLNQFDEAQQQLDQIYYKSALKNKSIDKEWFEELQEKETDFRLMIIRGHDTHEKQFLKALP